MNYQSIGIISLRGSALALALAGQTRASGTLYLLADALEAGHNVDTHMANVAKLLADRASTDADWADVYRRIDDDFNRLHKKD